jgi:hypothetical protein
VRTPTPLAIPSGAVDEAYFQNYCGHGSYDENYLFHSGVEHCTSIMRRLGVEIESVLVLGAATGRVLEHFNAAWGLRPWGCELSAWAHARIPAAYRRRIRCEDMRSYVPGLEAARRDFDLLFTNSLIYLQPGELPDFVDLCSRVCGHMHFYSSTSESYEPGDRYRTILRPRSWWREQFMAGGFEPTRSPYVWRSQQRAGWLAR